MIPTRRYKYIGKLTAIFLVAVFMIAATGFSYSIHYCHGNLTDVVIYPELTHSMPSCGCAIKHESNMPDEYNSGISKSSCCKNLQYFQKIQVLTFEHVKKVHSISVISILPVLLPGISPSLLETETDNHLSSYMECTPPRGVQRVIMFHQLRIPSPLSDC